MKKQKQNKKPNNKKSPPKTWTRKHTYKFLNSCREQESCQHIYTAPDKSDAWRARSPFNKEQINIFAHLTSELKWLNIQLPDNLLEKL